MRRAEQSECAHAVQALGQDVLKEAAKELVGRERHGFALERAAVSVAESDHVVGAGDNGAVSDGGLVHVATEVAEDGVAALHGGLDEDDPFRAHAHVGDAHAVG